jgi:hypothetical protein
MVSFSTDSTSSVFPVYEFNAPRGQPLKSDGRAAFRKKMAEGMWPPEIIRGNVSGNTLSIRQLKINHRSLNGSAKNSKKKSFSHHRNH